MILAIETASTDTSVALANPDGTLVAIDGQSGDHRQNGTLVPRIEQLMGGRGLDVLTLVAVGIGPGSFTGLRVGMSLAKGIAHGLKLPIVGIASLEAWLAAEPDAAGALCRAGAREAYLLPRHGEAPIVVAAEQAAAHATQHVLVAPVELAAAFGLVGTRPPTRAAAGIAAAAARHAEPADLATLEPRYGRPPRGLEPPNEGAVRWL